MCFSTIGGSPRFDTNCRRRAASECRLVRMFWSKDQPRNMPGQALRGGGGFSCTRSSPWRQMGMGSGRHDPATLPRGIIPATRCKWGMSASQGRSGPVWKRGNFLAPPRFQPRSAQPVTSPYIVCVIPTPYYGHRGKLFDESPYNCTLSYALLRSSG
jgi:hypothetical protein